MPTKKTSLNNSLLLRGNTWYIHWNVPKALRNNPHFKGKKIYSKTLQTKDIYEARKMRDLLVSKFRAMADLSTTYAARRAFISHLAEASKAVEETKQKLIYLDGEKAFNAWDDLESAFNVAADTWWSQSMTTPAIEEPKIRMCRYCGGSMEMGPK
ncbi:DUF6538 domain-containing protein [Aeromonas encheleia]